MSRRTTGRSSSAADSPRSSAARGAGARKVVTNAAGPKAAAAKAATPKPAIPKPAISNAHIALDVNGEAAEVSFAPYKTLLEVLREDMGLMGTKHGCELGECGACAVLLDGEPVLSCLVLGLECGGRRVETVEGIDAGGRLHPLQEAFADLGAAQCGYCTPGILLTAKRLLDAHPSPSRAQIAEALSGNLCRCTGYLQIFEAVEAAIVKIAEKAR